MLSASVLLLVVHIAVPRVLDFEGLGQMTGSDFEEVPWVGDFENLEKVQVLWVQVEVLLLVHYSNRGLRQALHYSSPGLRQELHHSSPGLRQAQHFFCVEQRNVEGLRLQLQDCA